MNAFSRKRDGLLQPVIKITLWTGYVYLPVRKGLPSTDRHSFFMQLAGNEETKRFRPVGNDYVGRYDENVDASSMAEYSHCVLRVYHSNLADKVKFIDANNTVIKTINLDDNDEGLEPLETDYDNIARGMLATPAGHASFTATVSNNEEKNWEFF